MRCPRLIVPFALALAVLAAACENEIAPLRDDPSTFFAVHGFLDTGADTQFVRVDALRATVRPDPGPALDADVASTHLQTGLTTPWRDSLVALVDGGLAHLFHARFRPVPGGTYRLAVTRSDGARTEARVTVPPVPDVLAETIETGTGSLTQQVTLLDVSCPVENVRLTYRLASARTGAVQPLTIEYGDAGHPHDQGWQLQILLSRDRDLLLRRFQRIDDADTTILFLGLQMDFSLPSPEWANPDESPNITGGYGFFGAVGRYAVAWPLEAATVEALGFIDRQTTP
ncbi:DUF4249 family protein [Rhodocaloribacter litoris]|uniref:DUF4249 family protein n=1 Tax=Rhodocaloribacter litoris TaxID=2558931 RepID=UPI00141FD783|nr:DUF4249 family protein [Rhodocaloribacter litoris]QXD17066.1 DUF4249 family protein [Rhodocaloribacter litoris]GIV60080.1 MAG: hypothetical protein KatS3mg043_1169 [Rhodothermaceae bacterium]